MTIELEDESRLVYTIDETRRVWISTDGQTAVIETTRHNPTFKSDTDRARYFDDGLDTVDQLDQTQTTAVEDTTHPALEQDWPTDPENLLGAIRQLPNVNTDTQAVGQLLTLITESPAPPELRAATIEALGQLDLTLVGETPDGVRLRTQPTDVDDQILEFTIDRLGQLRRYVVINHDPTAPSFDTVMTEARYLPTIEADGLPQPGL